jgi:hypothetical protein
MGLFSWSEPTESPSSLSDEIADLKKSFLMLQKTFNSRALTIEGCVTNIIKLYQIQNMDIANLRRELMSFIIPNAAHSDSRNTADYQSTADSQSSTDSQYAVNSPAEDLFVQTDLSYPSDDDIKEAFVFSKTPGSSAYYKDVIRPALENVSHSVSFYVRLEDLFSAAETEYAPYKAFLRDRFIDYLIYDEDHIICAVIIPHNNSSAAETKKYLDFVERLLNIFKVPFLYNPTLEGLKKFLTEKEEV